MNNARPFNLAMLTFVLLIIGASVMAGQFGGESGGFDLSWNSIDAGGGASSGGTLTLTGTIGQPDSGPMLAGGTFELLGGFWASGGPVQPACPADITDNGLVNIDDLLAVINTWGATGVPGSLPADINANGVVNIDDLLSVINAWGMCPG